MSEPVEAPSIYSRVVSVSVTPDNWLLAVTSDGTVYQRDPLRNVWDVVVARCEYSDMDRLTDSGRKE